MPSWCAITSGVIQHCDVLVLLFYLCTCIHMYIQCIVQSPYSSSMTAGQSETPLIDAMRPKKNSGHPNTSMSRAHVYTVHNYIRNRDHGLSAQALRGDLKRRERHPERRLGQPSYLCAHVKPSCRIPQRGKKARVCFLDAWPFEVHGPVRMC